MRRARIGNRNNLSNHPLVPTYSGFDKEVIFVGTIAGDFAIWDVQTVGTDTGGLGKYLDQINFAKSIGAECRECGLLSTESRNLLGRVIIASCRIAVRSSRSAAQAREEMAAKPCRC